MGRAPCCSKVGLHRGPWTSKEDSLLTDYITSHGEGQWRSLPKQAGLLRCGKSCRLRWMNYLRPDIKRGNITAQEDDLIIRLHSLLGNRWSLIAGRLPGRTDNEIKNYWNTSLSKKIITTSPSPSKNITIKRKSPKKKSSSPSPAELEVIKTKHMVHQPKSVRLGSIRHIYSLVQTSESNNNNNNNSRTNLECSSFSSDNNMNINNMNINNNNYNNNDNSCSSEEGEQEIDHVADLELEVLFCNNRVSNGAWGDDEMLNGLYEDQALVDPLLHAVNNNNCGVWETLYEEYLRLTSDGCEVERQSQEESLFI